MATPKIIASPHATALSGELKTISSSRIKAHTATTPAKVTNRLARSFMASPSVPPYFSMLLFIFCNSGCVNPERNKASSVTFISSRPLSPRSVFPIADCASNHTDELYSNPHDVCPMNQISDNRSHKAPLVIQQQVEPLGDRYGYRTVGSFSCTC